MAFLFAQTICFFLVPSIGFATPMSGACASVPSSNSLVAGSTYKCLRIRGSGNPLGFVLFIFFIFCFETGDVPRTFFFIVAQGFLRTLAQSLCFAFKVVWSVPELSVCRVFSSLFCFLWSSITARPVIAQLSRDEL